ncbi:hypothetical protein C5167_027115 [Papaver somniferum]|nr:hypothetical protein C5167_027115 [Papaver somniferum]
MLSSLTISEPHNLHDEASKDSPFQRLSDDFHARGKDSLKGLADFSKQYMTVFHHQAIQMPAKMSQPCAPSLYKLLKSLDSRYIILANQLCAFVSFLHFPNFVQTGLAPLKGTQNQYKTDNESYLTNGYLPSYVWTTDPNDAMLNILMRETGRNSHATALTFNTFDALEMEVLDAVKSQLPLPPVYTVGPLHLLLNQFPICESQSLGSNLWREDTKCLKWLDSKEPNSIVTNHSFTTITHKMEKIHLVCIPYPVQSHISSLMKLAKILHIKGCHITFVNTEFNHPRLIYARGADPMKGLPDFRFETIPDGLPPPNNQNASQDIQSLSMSTDKNCLGPFRNLIHRLNNTIVSNVPPVSCVIADGCMSFTLQVAKEFGIPDMLYWPISFCAFVCFLHFPNLVQRCLVPLKDVSYLTSGYLDTLVDWIPGIKDVRFRALPSYVRTTDPNDAMLNILMRETGRNSNATALIFNTFDALEMQVLDAVKTELPLPPIYTVGHLHLLLNQFPLTSLLLMTTQQLVEFAWGLANSKHNFLWIIRPDLVAGELASLPAEFTEQTKERGLLASWCPQEDVLHHASIAGFLTHCGWNSTLEGLSCGVPLICWPFLGDQQTNCRNSCNHWEVGMEIDSNVQRDEVERLVRELMEGEKGKKIKKIVLDWKKKAEEAASPGGSSYATIDKIISEILGSKIRDHMEKIHVVCIPYPIQSHISSMMKLAKILHFRGFHITFVNTEFNHQRLLNARGPDSVKGLADFHFETIPDGLPPPSNPNASQDIPTLFCAFVCFLHFPNLIQRGLVPLKGESYLTNGYMEYTLVDWIPGVKDIRFRDLPSFVRTTNPNDAMLNFFILET